MHRLRNLLTLCASLLLGTTYGQVHVIGEGPITACSGAIVESTDGSGYPANATIVTTICPDSPGSRVALSFDQFMFPAEVGSVDSLFIHIGTDESGDLLGVYTGSAPQGMVIASPYAGTSGCLTLVLRTNAAGSGSFSLGIACLPECITPTPVITTTDGDTARICPGDTLLLDGAGSIAAPGSTILAWHWDLWSYPDATTNTPVLQQAFTAPGVYRVMLNVMDDIGCSSAGADSLLVLVSPIPTFTGTEAPTLACLGVTAEMIGQFQSAPLPSQEATSSNPMPIQDIDGVPQSSTISVFGAPAGAVISDPAELGDICISLEHSFMGDLVVQLTCPNGQSAILHQQGGGATNLGLANDFGPEPGSCWTYCFNTSPEHGTWVESSYSGSDPNVTTGANGQYALQPGTYNSITPLDQLVGCPVEGDWTLTFTDLWGSDDGYLCLWSLGLTELANEYADLSPEYSAVAWSGTNVMNEPGGGGVATVLFDLVGHTQLTLSVTNDFGCSFDSLLTVLVVDEFFTDAGPDLDLCAGPGQLNGGLTGTEVELACTYELVLFEAFGDGWNGGAHVDVLINGDTIATYTAPTGNLSISYSIPTIYGQALALFYQAGTIWNGENRLQLLDASGTVLYSSSSGPSTGILWEGMAMCPSVNSGPFFSWSPTLGLSDPTSLDPFIFSSTGGWYTLSAEVPGDAGCISIDSVWVQPPPSQPFVLEWDPAAGTLCASVSNLDNYVWWVNGVIHDTTSTSCLTAPFPPGRWSVLHYPADTCVAYSDTVLICPELSIIVDGIMLRTTPEQGTYAWTYNGEPLANSTSPHAVFFEGSGTYSVTVTTNYGCEVTATLDVTVGLAENITRAPELALYPNPNDGRFTVVAEGLTNGAVSLEVLDLSGRILHQQRINAAQGRAFEQLELQLAPGTYVVRLLNGAHQRMARAVVR